MYAIDTLTLAKGERSTKKFLIIYEEAVAIASSAATVIVKHAVHQGKTHVNTC